MVESIGQDAPPHLLSLRQEMLATPFYSLSKSMMIDFWSRFEASTSMRIYFGKGGGGAIPLHLDKLTISSYPPGYELGPTRVRAMSYQLQLSSPRASVRSLSLQTAEHLSSRPE
jgi:hypothetical protein